MQTYMNQREVLFKKLQTWLKIQQLNQHEHMIFVTINK